MRPNKAETVLPELHPKTDVAIYIVLETICWMHQSEHCLQWCVNRFQCFSGLTQCSKNGSGTREFRKYKCIVFESIYTKALQIIYFDGPLFTSGCGIILPANHTCCNLLSYACVWVLFTFSLWEELC